MLMKVVAYKGRYKYFLVKYLISIKYSDFKGCGKYMYISTGYKAFWLSSKRASPDIDFKQIVKLCTIKKINET